MFPYQVNVSSKYGAPMGRPSDPVDQLRGRVHLRRVPFVDGDYDQGGAYWGGAGLPLYCVWDDSGSANYFRARDRAHAKSLLQRLGLKFYR
jgi:hypothetical protein